MATTASRECTPIPADPEKLERLLTEFANACGVRPDKIVVTVQYEFEDGGRDIRSIEPAAFTRLVPIAQPIAFVTLRKGALSDPSLHIHVRKDHVSLIAVADTMSLAKEIRDKAVACLGLAAYEPPPSELIATLEKRVDAVQALQQESVSLRCFLSFRFSKADEALADQVERFLRLHDVEVLTGRSYEPRPVEDKVRSRLSGSLDFVVYLLTSSGDSSWLRDEAAEARAARIPVIPLVEESVEFSPGLFGNVERIPFAPGHIGDIWIRLTEALLFIRATRRRMVSLAGEPKTES